MGGPVKVWCTGVPWVGCQRPAKSRFWGSNSTGRVQAAENDCFSGKGGVQVGKSKICFCEKVPLGNRKLLAKTDFRYFGGGPPFLVLFRLKNAIFGIKWLRGAQNGTQNGPKWPKITRRGKAGKDHFPWSRGAQNLTGPSLGPGETHIKSYTGASWPVSRNRTWRGRSALGGSRRCGQM